MNHHSKLQSEKWGTIGLYNVLLVSYPTICNLLLMLLVVFHPNVVCHLIELIESISKPENPYMQIWHYTIYMTNKDVRANCLLCYTSSWHEGKLPRFHCRSDRNKWDIRNLCRSLHLFWWFCSIFVPVRHRTVCGSCLWRKLAPCLSLQPQQLDHLRLHWYSTITDNCWITCKEDCLFLRVS